MVGKTDKPIRDLVAPNGRVPCGTDAAAAGVSGSARSFRTRWQDALQPGTPPPAAALQCQLLEPAMPMCFDLAWPLANLAPMAWLYLLDTVSVGVNLVLQRHCGVCAVARCAPVGA